VLAATLLKMLGGKHMVPRGQVQCLGYDSFHDIELNKFVSLLSGDWTRQVACVGNGVPFQADFSVGQMATNLTEALVRDGLDAKIVTSRRDRLVELLDMDLNWRLHQVPPLPPPCLRRFHRPLRRLSSALSSARLSAATVGAAALPAPRTLLHLICTPTAGSLSRACLRRCRTASAVVRSCCSSCCAHRSCCSWTR
jgi:hypothetical protein